MNTGVGENQKPRWDAFDDEQRTQFLKVLTENYGNITHAAEACGYDRGTIYRHMHNSPEFAAQVHEARSVGRFGLKYAYEDELQMRILDGVPEPVLHLGKHCLDAKGEPMWIRKKTDVSLIVGLKAEMPEKYKDRFEHSGPGGNPLNQTVVVYVPHNNRGPLPPGTVDPNAKQETATPTKA